MPCAVLACTSGDGPLAAAPSDASGTTTPGTGDGTSNGTVGTGGTGGPGTGTGSTTAGPPEGAPLLSPFIVIDDFGYLPDADKVAVIREPMAGYDADAGFVPGSEYALVDATSGVAVFTGSPTPWNGGAMDPSSGDRASWFDFSSVTVPSSYYVLDVQNNLRSPEFTISTDVYRRLLVDAVRTFYYQRAGFAKEAVYAGEAWADGASHLGPGQDTEARLYSAPDDASTARDVSGGWFDAGDYNKYTNWSADYVVELLRAYSERPEIWGDDHGIPESGNGVPDIVDEVKWGVDWLVKMQNDDGSLLSIVGLASGSPPSSATGPSYYGSPSTSASLSGAAAFALSAKVFEGLGPDFVDDAADLRLRAEAAWQFADANPDLTFFNNDPDSGSQGLGAGQQEVDDAGRRNKKIVAAAYLFDLTQDPQYRVYLDGAYAETTFIAGGYVYGWDETLQEALLHYSALPTATPDVATNIRNTYTTGVLGGDNLPTHRNAVDPYRAPLAVYTWGSNATKSRVGLVLHSFVKYGLAGADEGEVLEAAQGYLHYLHGVNPLGMAYLTNAGSLGAERSATQIFHTWFSDGSAMWDSSVESAFGPPPAFLAGGPNPSYEWDACCPASCGGNTCGAAPPSPPSGQPDQKSYLDFNTSWPINSWSVSENSNGYQVAYIRLLSKFVE